MIVITVRNKLYPKTCGECNLGIEYQIICSHCTQFFEKVEYLKNQSKFERIEPCL